MRRVYLDHTATTPVDPRVTEAMQPFYAQTFGNASSVHWYGRQAKAALEHARGTIAAAIGADPGELFFTSGGTESDNFAIAGAARATRSIGRPRILSSRAEHHAVLECCEHLQTEGSAVTLLPVTSAGTVEPDAFRSEANEKVGVISIMHANNEVGTVSPISVLAAIAHDCGALMHTDAVQSLGKIPVDVNALGVDLMSISAHKLYGPKGIGALYIRRGTNIEPLIHGGAQERGKRAGTENVPLAVGFAKAVEIAIGGMEEESERLRRLRNLLETSLRNTFPAILVNGEASERLPHILNISFDSTVLRLEGEMLLLNVDLQGIAVTSGSACSSGSMRPSHVLLAMGRDPSTAAATLRFAFGRGNDEDDVQYVVQCLSDIILRMTAHT